jgi:UDP-N-acetylglucosamine--N-acetylmuramyl-(pentapeptide) pyrophosphoryl-undecaprenol N-acetylglucosamine transferase
MELELVPRSGYAIVSVTASSFHRSIKPGDILHNLLAVARNAKALGQSKKIIKQFKPDIAIGTGAMSVIPCSGWPTLWA